MLSKIDEYMRKLADLEERESKPETMSTTEELGYVSELDSLWCSMSADERARLSCMLSGKRVT